MEKPSWMSEELRLRGANAAARGDSQLDNPLYRPGNMPAATGETIEAWMDRERSWRFGYATEAAVRGETGPLREWAEEMAGEDSPRT